jgi:hypothetical protein
MTFLSQLPFDLKCELDHRIHKEKFNKVKEELLDATHFLVELENRTSNPEYFHVVFFNRDNEKFYWTYFTRYNEPSLEMFDYRLIVGRGITQIKTSVWYHTKSTPEIVNFRDLGKLQEDE